MLNIIEQQLRKKGVEVNKEKMPKHIAITVGGIASWSKKKNATFEDANKKALKKVWDLIKYQTCFDIPIITIYLISPTIKDDLYSKRIEFPSWSIILVGLVEFWGSLYSDFVSSRSGPL